MYHFTLVIAAGIAGNGKVLYLIGAIVFTGLLLWQLMLMKPDDLGRVALAFQNANRIVSLVYSHCVIHDPVIFT